MISRGPDRLACPQDGRVYERVDGIWRFLPPERLTLFQPFIQDYEAIRAREGRGSSNPAYYRALPYRDLSGRFTRDWRIRASSYRTLWKKVVEPRGGSLTILDLGAGNGWLSYRLAQRGHRLIAIDLLVNQADGLGAYRHYDASFLPIQAEFDRLPLAERQADLVVFNASFHYTIDAAVTLGEARRVLLPGGWVVILDTPLYDDPTSGEQMVAERRAGFQARFGFPSDRLPSENYLTPRRLWEISQELGLAWRTITPFYGLRWFLRPWRARLLGKRAPARFVILVGRAVDHPGNQAPSKFSYE